MTEPVITSTELAAIQFCVDHTYNGKPKPKGSQFDYTREKAKSGLEKLAKAVAK